MISLISGKVLSIDATEVTVLTAGGVGYKLYASPGCREKCRAGENAEIPTYLVVREDALDLFGFKDDAERQLFKLFLSVSGVGPKTALNLLALGSVSETTAALGRGDVAYLTNVSGIGKKTAERLVVELKSKVGMLGASQDGAPVGDELGEVFDALVSLGYSSIEAREAIQKLSPKGKKTEQLIREALSAIK